MAKGDDAFSMLELLIGLPNVRVLSVDRVDSVLEIHLESAEPVRFCSSCGMVGVGRRVVMRTYQRLVKGRCWFGISIGGHVLVVMRPGRRNDPI
jgi:hypothetical protein